MGSGLVVLIAFMRQKKPKKMPQKPKIVNTEKRKNTEKKTKNAEKTEG